MIKDMTGVKISSEYFEIPTLLDFFPKHDKPPKNNRVALVYGNNGSGKSVIARGFREYNNNENSGEINLEMYKNNSAIEVTNKENIFIFDEDYISSRIKIKESGLDTIVLFGEQVDFDDKIKINKIDSEEIATEIENLTEKYKNYLDINNILSPFYWKNEINRKLKEPKGWAEKGATIKGHKQNLTVNDTEIKRLGTLVVNIGLNELLNQFDEDYKQLTSTDAQAEPLKGEIKLVSIVPNVDNDLKLLLSKTIDRPNLTKREEQLLDLFGIDKTWQVRDYISDKANILCDKCFQPIDENYRNDVLVEIKNILNQELAEFKAELEKLSLTEINVDYYQQYHNLNSYTNLITSIRDYNEAVKNHNSRIQNKIDNPFVLNPNDKYVSLLEERYRNLNEQLKKLELERNKYNLIVEKRSTFVNGLLDVNDAIAYYHIYDMYKNFKKQEKEKLSIEEELEKNKKKSEELNIEKKELDSQRKNFKVASNQIEKSLKYIFFSENRLTIELGSDQLYRVKVNGKDVPPNKISVGERNALALCYFFTEISEGKEEIELYSEEMLLVIDDPVSSFDIDNRVGMISLLRWKLGQVLDSCVHSKVLIMTHDISLCFNLEKSLNEISKLCLESKKYANYILFHLDNKQLNDFKYNKHNVYTQLMNKIYEYALADEVDDVLDLSVGNMMRRVLEAFSTFSFKLGISDISLDEKILNILPNENIKDYYKNLMFRVVLDNESHSEDNVRGFPELSFFSYLSSAEKQQTAKDVLCFIYRINKTHLLSHLPDSKIDIKKWCSIQLERVGNK